MILYTAAKNTTFFNLIPFAKILQKEQKNEVKKLLVAGHVPGLQILVTL